MGSRSPLISAARLADRLRTAAPVLLDVRWSLATGPQRGAYQAGHLPGARFVDLDRDLAAPPGARGRHPLPERPDFERAMRLAGVDDAGAVVVYDEANATAAARAWWLLRYFGHADVAVLDGGLTAWCAAGGELEEGTPEPAALGDFTARPGAMAVLDADAAAALAARGVLLDARAGERFRGESEPVDRLAGHIPGARNRPSAHNVGPDGRFLSAEDLRAGFGAVGARPGAEVGVYCGSGVTAAHEVLALELAGIAAALYPGSWSEWIVDPERPVAT